MGVAGGRGLQEVGVARKIIRIKLLLLNKNILTK